jgi:integration host factor subunit alpha
LQDIGGGILRKLSSIWQNVNDNQPIDKNRNLCERIDILPISSTRTETESARMALTKKDLIEQVSTELGFLRNQSAEIVQSAIEIVKSSLVSGDDVLISGFGKFCVKDKSERKGRNPATGEDAILPARRVVTFKCSGKLRDRINGG